MNSIINNITESIINQLSIYNLSEEDQNKVIFSYIAELYLTEVIKNKSKKVSVPFSIENLKKIYPHLFEDSICRKYQINISKIEIQLNFDDCKDVLGSFYEENLPLHIKKAMGQYYTRNNDTVLKMLDLLDYKGQNILGKTLLDPAVGSGLFLLEAISRIKENTKLIDKEKVIKLVWDSIYGIDIDEFACYICELNIVLSMLDEIMIVSNKDKLFRLERLNIVCKDFISFNEEFNQLELFATGTDTIRARSLNASTFPQKFDYIVSNPPYITLYGRRSKNMNETKRTYYNQNFDFVMNKKSNNKFNTVMFFMENAIKLVKEGNKICFIIDISFFESAYRDIRKYILEKCYVSNIITGINEFNSVVSGQLILLIERRKKNKYLFDNQVKWVDNENGNIYFISQSSWNNSENEYKFEKPLQNQSKIICEKISVYTKLGELFAKKHLRTCCALTGRSDDFMVSEFNYIHDNTDLIFPYLEGGKAFKNKFGEPIATNYFRYDYDLQQKISKEFKIELEKIGVKNKKRIALGDVESYRNPKIFIRQSATSLIATFTSKKYAANNSIYVLTNQINTPDNVKYLKYICAILNSNVLTFYARQKGIIRMAVGKTPQIKLADLKQLPIIIGNNRNQKEIVELTDALLNDSGKNLDVIKNLNDIIYSLYNISEEEKNYIENCLAK